MYLCIRIDSIDVTYPNRLKRHTLQTLNYPTVTLRQRGLLLALTTRRSSHSHSATRGPGRRRTHVRRCLRRLFGILARRVLRLTTYIFRRLGRFSAGVLSSLAHLAASILRGFTDLSSGVLCLIADLFGLTFAFLLAAHTKTGGDCATARFRRASQSACEAAHRIRDTGAEGADLITHR